MNHNCTIEIAQDDLDMNPRKEYDHLGTMVCWHDRYDLGDEQRSRWDSEDIQEEIDALISEGAEVLPLYLYDHSGLTMNTSGFSCGWDSGTVGFIYMTKSVMIENWGKKICTAKVRESARKCLVAEVTEYDQYLTGDIWYFDVTHNESGESESIGGIFGHEYAEQEAEFMAESLDSEHKAARLDHLKTMIRNRVPLEYRL